MFNWVKSFLIKVLHSFWHCWERFCDRIAYEQNFLDFISVSAFSLSPLWKKPFFCLESPMNSYVKTSMSCWSHASDRSEPRNMIEPSGEFSERNAAKTPQPPNGSRRENKTRLSFLPDNLYDCLQKKAQNQFIKSFFFFTFCVIKSNHRCNARSFTADAFLSNLLPKTAKSSWQRDWWQVFVTFEAETSNIQCFLTFSTNDSFRQPGCTFLSVSFYQKWNFASPRRVLSSLINECALDSVCVQELSCRVVINRWRRLRISSDGEGREWENLAQSHFLNV